MTLASFLLKAKKNTYASQGEKGEKKRSDGGKELTFKEKEYFYKDVYYGHNPFVGQELVFQKKKLVWAMQYYGSTTGNTKEVYTFLKKALFAVSVKKPFRGPATFKEGPPYTYKCSVKGDITAFMGKETITEKGKTIYTCTFQGGKVE